MSGQEQVFQFVPDGAAAPTSLWMPDRVALEIAHALGIPEHAVQVHAINSSPTGLSVELSIDAAEVTEVTAPEPKRPLWRFDQHRYGSPAHRMREDNEYVSVCGVSFEYIHSMATLNPQLHESTHPRCPDCVAASA